MLSTLTTAYAATSFLTLAITASAQASSAATSNVKLNAMTYQGCFSSSTPMTNQGSYTYQTSGYCQPICVGQNQAVLGLTGGSNCYCGDQLPPADSKVDDSMCSTPCDGYDKEDCMSTRRSSTKKTKLTRDQQVVAQTSGPSISQGPRQTQYRTTAARARARLRVQQLHHLHPRPQGLLHPRQPHQPLHPL